MKSNTTQNIFEQFSDKINITTIPLAERCRPGTLSELIGHKKFVCPGSPLRKQIQNGNLPSLILWGPPGVGKTTLARALAKETGLPFSSLSAVTSGKKEMTEIIHKADVQRSRGGKGFILFIDEIHRYNKAQQDGLLHAVEDGTIIFIGATTENPSFEVIAPLISRCQVLKLEPLERDELKLIVQRALKEDAVLSQKEIHISGMEELLFLGSGDARRTLNLLEMCFQMLTESRGKIDITPEVVHAAAAQNALLYDKKGDYHYDTISAFIKSVRGSDPDAAVFYLAMMLQSGEDPVFIARRLIILASEDIGNAEPYALSLANSGLQTVHAVGMPEARIILSQVTTYLASCPKSNAAYLAIENATKDVLSHSPVKIPMYLRNAPTKLMQQLGYNAGYKYPHDFPNHFVSESYLPEDLKNKLYYLPTDIGREKALKERLEYLWKDRRKK